MSGTSATRVYLGRGLFAVIDTADAELVFEHRWYATRMGKRIYAYRRIRNGKNAPQEFMHRLLLGLDRHDGLSVDHVNGDGLDNRRANLRLATNAENGRNRGPNRNNTSGYKRVCWHRGAQKWLASIQVNRQQINLGLYDDPVEAALAYDRAAIEHFGEFAWTNFPKDDPRLLTRPTREAKVDSWRQAS